MPLFPHSDRTPLERAAYAALRTSVTEPPKVGSAVLRRIRATAGTEPVNSTDIWTSGGDIRLKTTDSPPCNEPNQMFTDGPCALGW